MMFYNSKYLASIDIKKSQKRLILDTLLNIDSSCYSCNPMPCRTSTVYYSLIMLLESMFIGINHLTTGLRTVVDCIIAFLKEKTSFGHQFI